MHHQTADFQPVWNWANWSRSQFWPWQVTAGPGKQQGTEIPQKGTSREVFPSFSRSGQCLGYCTAPPRPDGGKRQGFGLFLDIITGVLIIPRYCYWGFDYSSILLLGF